MARIVMKHPRDFKPGDIVCDEDDEIFSEMEITETLGWSEAHGAYGVRFLWKSAHTTDHSGPWATYFHGEATYKVKRG